MPMFSFCMLICENIADWFDDWCRCVGCLLWTMRGVWWVSSPGAMSLRPLWKPAAQLPADQGRGFCGWDVSSVNFLKLLLHCVGLDGIKCWWQRDLEWRFLWF